VLAVTAGAHFLHDGFSDIIYVLLPLWAAEFSLSLTQVGIIRTAYTGGMSAFQIPAGLLAERVGERRVLVLGTLVTAAGFVVAGSAGGFFALLLVLLGAGLGSAVQHPLASSLVSQAYETGRRRTALGTYNFSGDLGKVAVPAAVALLATVIGWRWAAGLYGVVGLAAAIVIWLLLRRLDVGGRPVPRPRADAAPAGGGWGIRDARSFQALTLIGMIDNGTRSPFLTFLPFVLLAKGATVAGVGGAMALLFAGGAAGKLLCGLMAERVGIIRAVVITEVATMLGILAVVTPGLPLEAVYVVLVPLGVALNGTSSVLYGTVAELVTPERRARAYGLFYTLTIATSALAPTLYGLLGDVIGAPATLAVVGLVVLVTLPLCFVLRAAVAEPARA
ncbi:MAG TPA: MFS transporter, partial [Terriglobales bacterium]|nr:MFS transporter [Terriglobales bacterium]